MNGRLIRNIGFTLLPFAFLFLFEPGISIKDPIPDCIGYVIFCLAIRNLADIEIKNKETALNLLKSKLFQIELKNKQKEIKDLKGDIMNIDFGSQIRNYTLEPYSLVKDLRTNFENTNTEKVLNGDIIDFMKEYLRIKR